MSLHETLKGRIVRGVNRRVSIQDTYMSEVNTILEGTGTKLVIEKGWKVVVIETDSDIIIKQITGKDPKKRKGRTVSLINNINSLAESFDIIS